MPEHYRAAATALSGPGSRRAVVNRTERPLVLVELFDGTAEFREVNAQTVVGVYPVI